jgi:hypothetical protein
MLQHFLYPHKRHTSPTSLSCRLRLKCDSTRAETRFRLSAKQTSPFKSPGASVQSTSGRRAVHISLQDLYYSCKPVFCSHVTLTGYHTPFFCFPFTYPPVRHRVPSQFNWTLPIYLAVTALTSSIKFQPASPLVASAVAGMKCYAHSWCYGLHKRINFGTTSHYSKEIQKVTYDMKFNTDYILITSVQNSSSISSTIPASSNIGGQYLKL